MPQTGPDSVSKVALLPENPELRQLAEALEEAGISADILDAKWRYVFSSSELARIVGLDPSIVDRYYGVSPIVRPTRFPDVWGVDPETSRLWWDEVVPVMLHDVPIEDPHFEAVFDWMAPRVRELQPKVPALAHRISIRMSASAASDTWHGAVQCTLVRLHGQDGEFVGILMMTTPDVPQSLANRLARGDTEMFRRMERLRDPSRRATAILFADLAASGELSRRLSSQSYFKLIRSLTDLIDGVVSARQGILGKHAGDGASALFLADDAGGESAAARNAIDAARAIRDEAALISAGVQVKVGIHWGATLVVGQVSTHGRLEVTALGDEMNEAARIESTARGGSILASKTLLERLDDDDATALGISPDQVSYRTVADLGGAEKAIRDAGTIAVAEL